MAVITGGTRTSLANLFKVDYSTAKVGALFNDTSKLNKLIPGNSVAEGTNYVVPMLSADSDAGRFMGETDDFPTPRNVENLQGTFNLKMYSRTVQVTHRAISSGGGAGAFVPPLIQEINRHRVAMAVDMDRYLFMPYTGQLATITAVTSTTQFTISWYGLVNVGMYVDVLVASSGSTGAGIVNSKITAITSKNKSTGTALVTIATACAGTIDTTYAIFRSGEYAKNRFGLPDIISASNPSSSVFYANLDRTSAGNVDLQANAFDATGYDVNGELFASAMDDVFIESGDEPDMIIVHPYVMRQLLSWVKPDARAKMSDLEYELFARTGTVRGTKLMSHRFCHPSKAYFMTKEYWRIDHPDDATPMGMWSKNALDSGSYMIRHANKPIYGCQWIAETQVVCTKPRAQLVMSNIAWTPGPS